MDTSDKLRKVNEAIQTGIRIKSSQTPQYKFLTYEYNKGVVVPLQNLTRIIVQNTVTRVDLNHANGENKLASDLISSCYITNILEQIKTVKTDTKTGLENLYQMVSQSDQYAANPILFGLKDRNGRQLINGIFDVVGEITPKATHYINDEADKLLDFILFDGIRDEVSSNGINYTKMSKRDYLISQLIAFKQKFSNKQDRIGGYFLRVQSDAGKNFICETVKYNTVGLFTIQGYRNATDTIKSNFNHKYRDVYDKYGTNNRLLAEIRNIPDKYKCNRITAERAFDLLITGKINDLDISRIKNHIDSIYEVTVPLIVTKYAPDKNGIPSDVNSFVIFVKGKRNPQNIVESAEVVSINCLYLSVLNDYLSVEREIEHFIDVSEEIVENYAASYGLIVHTVDKNLDSYLALYNQVISEIRTFVNQLNNVFELDGNDLVSKDNSDIRGLYDVAQYLTVKDKTYIVKDGRLAGGFFKFKKLFNVNGKDYSQRLIDALLLYGESSTTLLQSNGESGLKINEDVTRTGNSFVKIDKYSDIIFSFQETPELREVVDNILSEWLYDYIKDLNRFYQQYSTILNGSGLGSIGSKSSVIDWGINYAITNMCFDDLLEGSTAFYKDAKTFLKNTNGIQFSGKAFASNTMEVPFGAITNNSIKKYNVTNGTERATIEDEVILIKQKIVNEDGSVKYEKRPYYIPCKESKGISSLPLTARNGFRSITIKNCVTHYDLTEELRRQVYEETLKKVNDETIANQVADNIAKSHRELNTVNDAKSYITLDEFIRRRYLDGTLDEYQDLLAQLLDTDVEVHDLNLADINAKIRVQKNAYYDIYFDSKTRTYVPRQIKNVTIVLIPKLLPEMSDFRKLADLMQKYDINQINTEDTIKTGKKNVITLLTDRWNNGDKTDFAAFEEELKDENNIENYYYRYLYKQQDGVDHIQDERNKSCVQIAKVVYNKKLKIHPAVNKSIHDKNFTTTEKAYHRLECAVKEDGLEDIGDSLSFNSTSPYNPITQIQFFDNSVL